MDLETSQLAQIAPWTDRIFICDKYSIFKDGFPVTEGHLLFVPADDTPELIHVCLQMAYDHGASMVEMKKYDGFNVGMNSGIAAGQTVMYPHIHLIPRRSGDMDDPKGGIRAVIPDKQKY